jgi:hypothetical protein
MQRSHESSIFALPATLPDSKMEDLYLSPQITLLLTIEFSSIVLSGHTIISFSKDTFLSMVQFWAIMTPCFAFTFLSIFTSLQIMPLCIFVFEPTLHPCQKIVLLNFTSSSRVQFSPKTELFSSLNSPTLEFFPTTTTHFI